MASSKELLYCSTAYSFSLCVYGFGSPARKRERRPDPVVVLFFGDHWPKLEDGFNQAVLEGYDSTLDMYRVPFFLWANAHIHK